MRSSWRATVSESETGANERRAVWKFFMVVGGGWFVCGIEVDKDGWWCTKRRWTVQAAKWVFTGLYTSLFFFVSVWLEET